MNDSEFVQYLYSVSKTIKNRPSLSEADYDSLTTDQMLIYFALSYVQIIGENGETVSGLKRMEQKFPKNFNGELFLGKGNKGRKNNSNEKELKKYVQVKKLRLLEGLTQEEACSRACISESTFRRYSDKIHPKLGLKPPSIN